MYVHVAIVSGKLPQNPIIISLFIDPNMASLEELKKVACETIDKLSGDLHNISKVIWEKPELAYEEHAAHDVLCDFLEKQGEVFLGVTCKVISAHLNLNLITL